ncbi:MAG TPA: hypothetical protein VMI94_29095 [Bryobacteraceae bacterium]|nr:hypothetical protein [Bryobacteraceae bacterium]
MAAEAEKEISGLDLLRQPATLALARYLEDLGSMLGFQAYLWRMIMQVDYGHGDPAKFPKPGEQPPPKSAVAQMDIHSAVLNEMAFCRNVNSFLTYLADLMTLIYEKYPKKLPSNKQTTYGFCIEHHMAGDLIPALAEETVMALTYQNIDALAKYFKKNLGLALFTKNTHAANASLCVDIRNIITHNRGIVNRLLIHRNPRFADDLGKRVEISEKDSREMLGTLGYCARQLDLRAVKKFGLVTIEPEFKKSGDVASP